MGNPSESTPSAAGPAAPPPMPQQPVWLPGVRTPWQPALRTLVELNPWVQGALVAVLFMLLHEPLWHITRYYWYLPAGFRFAALLLLPKRLWPWLILGEWGARFQVEVARGTSLYHSFYSVFPQPLGSVIAVGLLRWHNQLPDLHRPAGMLRLLGSIALSASIEVAVNVMYLLQVEVGHNPTPALSTFVPSIALGDTMGVLVVAPAALALWLPATQREKPWPLLADVFFALVLPLLAFHWSHQVEVIPLVHDYVRVLLASPVAYFAFRYGWRGAALSLTVLSASVAIYHTQQVPSIPGDIAATQMLLAVSGAVSLVLGSAIDALRNHRRQLALQNMQLLTANARLSSLARQLQDAARRNLEAEERQRRRIAAELHDELGQNLTALQMHAALAARDMPPALASGFRAATDPILQRMRHALRHLMDTLRPATLDEFGLLRALREGPVTDLLQAAGVRYRLKLAGEPALLDALDEPTRIATWRIVQEAANNAVKHARARNFDVRLRIGVRGNRLWLLLDVRDDGVGLSASNDNRRGHGLQGMRDRMLALDGVFRIADTHPGTRLRVLLRQAL